MFHRGRCLNCVFINDIWFSAVMASSALSSSVISIVFC